MTEWRAFAAVEPMGEARMDHLAALICATLANVHRDPQKRSESYGVEDFLPKFWQTPADVAREQQRKTYRKMAAQKKYGEARGRAERAQRDAKAKRPAKPATPRRGLIKPV